MSEPVPGNDAPWARPPDEVLADLEVDPAAGLSAGEVEERRERHGHNELRAVESPSVLRILWNQLKSLIVVLLIGAAAVSLAFDQPVDALAIGVVLLLNTLIGFVTEWRAQRSMEALRRMGRVDATVLREGEERSLPAEELVPGDVVLLRREQVVPADLRLVRVEGLRLVESALTGESVPVEKQAEAVSRDAELPDRRSMAYRGTSVAGGEATGAVVATGMRTELGEISAMVERTEGGQAPLDERLDQLGQRLVWITLGVAGVVIATGLLAGRDPFRIIETGVALAVAAIPEGLPIVATLALARGMVRMMRQNARMRQLSAVETLGSTRVVCTDKTGTLTENRMALRHLEAADGGGALTWTDGAPRELSDGLRRAAEVMVLANQVEDGGRSADGMEQALLDAGAELGLAYGELAGGEGPERLVPFRRETSMLGAFHRRDGRLQLAVKGALEAVLEASARGAGGEPLDDEDRRRWTERGEELAGTGLRVLGLATRDAGDADEEPYRDLEFVGLVGLLDPPREEVQGALQRCRDAGIRVVMVTGDHPATARAIGAELGIGDGAGEPVRGADIGDPDEAGDELRERVTAAPILARVSPRHKLALVDWLQERGDVVAMTGDGVNDAPALRSADIGIAMGERGTQVAREAADLVLLDDRFPTIVAAVEQGRIILENIRKFVIYLLSGNVGEILVVAVAMALPIPQPLLPLQILYLNVLNDVFPALALGIGPGSADVMDAPPRDPREPLIGRRHWALTVAWGALIGATLLGVFLLALHLGLPDAEAVTVTFLSLSLGRLLHAFNMRDPGSGVVVNDITRNPAVWGALALCAGMLALAVYLPPLAAVLGVTPPGATGWALVAGASVTPLLVGQVALALWPAGRAQEPSPTEPRAKIEDT